MKVVAAAQEVGGAQAMIPVIQNFRACDGVKVSLFAAGKAAAAFRAAGLDFEIIDFYHEPAPLQHHRVSEIMLGELPDVVLLGTAWGPSIDKAFIATADACDVPTVSIIDMWSNYRERFLEYETGALRLPTKIALMDSFAMSQAVEAGLDESRLVVTGQPHLESLAKRFREPAVVDEAFRIRRAWVGRDGGRKSEAVVLFVSEAIAADFGPDTPYYRGYTETDAIEGLIRAVDLIESERESRFRIVVKLHPEQSIESIELGPLAQNRGVLLESDTSAMPCVMAADVVVGMTSMLLLESAIGGKPVISFQPGVEATDAFIGTTSGLMPLASTVEGLSSEIGAALHRTEDGSHPSRAQSELVHTGACQRVTDLMFQLSRARITEGVA